MFIMTETKKSRKIEKCLRKNKYGGFRSLLETTVGIAITLVIAASVIAYGFILVWIANLIFG